MEPIKTSYNFYRLEKGLNVDKLIQTFIIYLIEIIIVVKSFGTFPAVMFCYDFNFKTTHKAWGDNDFKMAPTTIIPIVIHVMIALKYNPFVVYRQIKAKLWFRIKTRTMWEKLINQTLLHFFTTLS